MKAFSHGLPFVALIALSGCVAVTNLDRFSRRTATSDTYSDIEFSVSGMTSHVKEYFEARIIDNTGTTQTLLVSEVLGGDAEQFTIPAGVPIDTTAGGPYKIEFYADHNHDGTFDLAPDPADHSWIVNIATPYTPDPLDGVIRIPFQHTTNFNPLDAEKKFGANALIHVKNVAGLAGKRLQIRLSDLSRKQTVGMYRVPVLAKPSFDAQMRGIIDASATGTKYQLDVIIDEGGAAGAKIT